jgi:murein L,D-transpeptidase YcbB/YkuD
MQVREMIRRKIKRLGMYIGLVGILFGTQSVNAKSSMEFNDVTATVMMNSLAPLEKNHFLKQLYSQLFFVPVWIQEEKLSPLTQTLFKHIREDKTLLESSKLKQDAVVLSQKASEIYPAGTVAQKVDLEFRISQLYKGYADYILYGSINWGAFQARLYNLRSKGIKAEWVTYKPAYSPVSLLEEAAISGSLEKVLEKATPKGFRYKSLQEALYSYLELEKQGGWKPVPLKGKLRVGKSYKIVPALRERLALSGDQINCSSETNIYDNCLKDAVIHFQKRHGLEAKGTIGKNTITALNVPLSHRIKQIRLNLDRIKWLYQRQSKRHIMINIPAFTLFFEEDGALIQQMKVITGRTKNPTPVFSDTVSTIVLNPHWNVPKSIIQKEMIPKLMRNPNAMAKKGIEIRSGWGKDAKKISGASVDWSKYRYSKTVPFHFAQVPGTRNALGKVKFLFPNQFSVYMHDTPNKRLFNRTVRAFSHGCIRLHKPRELLKTFSTFNDSVNFEKAQKRLKGKKKAYLKLDHQVPVDVMYLTSYVDNKGVLQFRNDIYGYDKMQLQSYRQW